MIGGLSSCFVFIKEYFDQLPKCKVCRADVQIILRQTMEKAPASKMLIFYSCLSCNTVYYQTRFINFLTVLLNLIILFFSGAIIFMTGILLTKINMPQGIVFFLLLGWFFYVLYFFYKVSQDKNRLFDRWFFLFCFMKKQENGNQANL